VRYYVGSVSKTETKESAKCISFNSFWVRTASEPKRSEEDWLEFGIGQAGPFWATKEIRPDHDEGAALVRVERWGGAYWPESKCRVLTFLAERYLS
jgi:hypothetical protein